MEMGNMGGQQDQMAQMVSQIAQTLQSGASPTEVVMQLLSQGMGPEQIVQILINAGLPQDQAVQSVQSASEQMQSQQADPNAQAQGMPPEGGAQQPAMSPEQMMAMGGQIYNRQLKKMMKGGNVDMPQPFSENYANDMFQIFTKAVRENVAKNTLFDNSQQAPSALPKAADGLDMALNAIGATRETYRTNLDVRNRVNEQLLKNGQQPIQVLYEDALKNLNITGDQVKNDSAIQGKVREYFTQYGFDPENANIAMSNVSTPSPLNVNNPSTRSMDMSNPPAGAQVFQSNSPELLAMRKMLEMYQAGVDPIRFSEYADPRGNFNGMAPGLRVLNQLMGNDPYGNVRRVKTSNLPSNFDVGSFLANAMGQGYTVGEVTPYKKLFSRGVRISLNPVTGQPQATPAAGNNPANTPAGSSSFAGPGYEGFNADANGDGIPDYLSPAAPNVNAPVGVVNTPPQNAGTPVAPVSTPVVQTSPKYAPPAVQMGDIEGLDKWEKERNFQWNSDEQTFTYINDKGQKVMGSRSGENYSKFLPAQDHPAHISKPIQAFGGQIPQAFTGVDLKMGMGVNSGDVADMAKNAMEYLTAFINRRQPNPDFFSTANTPVTGPMERGLYDQQGNFMPYDIGNQTLNPTNAFSNDPRIMYMAGGGSVPMGGDDEALQRKAQATFDVLNANPILDRKGNPLQMKKLEPIQGHSAPRMVGKDIVIPGVGTFKEGEYQPMPTPEGYGGYPIYLVNGKPVVVDPQFNKGNFQMYKDPNLLRKDELFPIYGKGTPYMAMGGDVEISDAEMEEIFKLTGKRLKRL